MYLSSYQNSNLNVYDRFGKLVSSYNIDPTNKRNEFKMDKLKPGLYYLDLLSDYGHNIQKVIKSD